MESSELTNMLFLYLLQLSALALLKMVMHARSGGNLEVMGLLLGKVDASVMVVMVTFLLTHHLLIKDLKIRPFTKECRKMIHFFKMSANFRETGFNSRP